MNERKFLDTMRCEHMCFAIIPNEGKEVEELPTEVTNLLVEFQDIVLDNFPDRLRPV